MESEWWRTRRALIRGCRLAGVPEGHGHGPRPGRTGVTAGVRRPSWTALAVLLFTALAAGCDEPVTGPSGTAEVTGTVTYRERIALPDDAVIEVTLSDVSRQDAPAPIIARTTFVSGGRQVPLPFRLGYDRVAIEPSRVYAVRATIRVGGQLAFTTDTVVRVITQGAPSAVDLLLVRAG